VDIFGYVQFGGIFVTPIIALVFDKDRVGSKMKKSDVVKMLPLSETEERVHRLRQCIAPFAITNILCIVFCVVSAIENLYLQVGCTYLNLKIDYDQQFLTGQLFLPQPKIYSIKND